MTSELRYTGCNNFRMRIVLSLLTGRPVRISHIRSRSAKPGLNDAEVCFLRLVDELSNGLTISIGENGTRVFVKPAILVGGNLTFDANCVRGLGYYLEPLLLLAPFFKTPIDALLRGVTNNNTDPSVEMIVQAWLPVYKQLLGAAAADKLELKLMKRGTSPRGGGEVRLKCSTVGQLMPLKLSKLGKVFKVRGVAWTCKVSPGICTRMVAGAKKAFKNLLSDVYVTADACTGDRGGLSPGFGLTLHAETKTGVVYSAEATSLPVGALVPSVPDELGEEVAQRLCKEILQSGGVDSGAQGLVLAMMALGPRNVSSVLIGPLTPHAVATLRLLKDFLGVRFQIKSSRSIAGETAEPASTLDHLVCTCVGSGRLNFEKSTGREREFQIPVKS